MGSVDDFAAAHDRLKAACALDVTDYSQCDEDRTEIEFVVKWEDAPAVRRELLTQGAVFDVDTLGTLSGSIDAVPVFVSCEVPVRQALLLLAGHMVRVEESVTGGLAAILAGEVRVPVDLDTDKVWAAVDDDDSLSGTPAAWLIGVVDQALGAHQFASRPEFSPLCETIAALLVDVSTAHGVHADDPYWWDAVQYVTDALSDPDFNPVRTARALEGRAVTVASRAPQRPTQSARELL